MSTIKLNKHFTYSSKNHIVRKLFLCRICNLSCTPLDFRSFNKTKTGEFIYIATAYACDACNKKFITSSLNSGRRVRVRDTYNTLTDGNT